MKDPPQNYVSLVQDGKVYIKNIALECIEPLKILGATQEGISGEPCWIITYHDDQELARLFEKLRNLDFSFVDTPGGWPPSAVYKELRDRNLLSGSFSEITWTGKGKWVKREA